MRVWSYCAADWIRATAAAGGVKPLTSPPLDHISVAAELAKATESDLVYLNLHGFEGQPACYGQRDGVIGPTALTAKQIAAYDWSDVVIFAEVCFSAADGGSDVARAFLRHGARAFVGSTTEAYGRITPTIFDGEADKLMFLFRKAYERQQEPRRALELAKRLLQAMSFPLDADDRATLESFTCLEAK